MIVENADGSVRHWTFGELLAASSRLANALKAKGIEKGDRVGVFLSQSAELTICHLAGYRMGAVVLPLFTLFGEEALEYRMSNAEASALITDMSQLPKVLAAIGLTPRQVMATLVVNATILTAFGAAVGTAAGLAVAPLLVNAQGQASGLGWGIAVMPSAGMIAAMLALTLLVATAAALLLALRAARAPEPLAPPRRPLVTPRAGA